MVKIKSKGKGLCLVTGGSGFVGYHIVRRLLDEGYSVRVIDNLSRNCNNILDLEKEGKVEFIHGDIRYDDTVRKVMKDVDYIFHEAAICINRSKEFPKEAIDVNLVGSFNIFQAAIDFGVKKVVFASTSSVYGQPEYLPVDEKHPLNPQTPYESAKLCAEHMLKFLAKKHNIKYNILRYFNVYGKKQSTDAYYTSVINTFIKRVLAGEPPVINGKGDQSMDFTHVSDVVEVNMRALESDISGEVFNVAKGEETTIAEVANIILKHCNSKLKPTFIEREVLVTRRRADTSKIKKMLNYEPKVSFTEGIKEVIKDIKENPQDY
ncbi:SDR family NAD(P)-dependent oxidoreductase [Candidatus Woesearchaeota archaeon]|nr:SDR family NAD(P)-dependent oxidoreductase [Candidatus Woesearchaeota archaeon]